MPSLTWCALFIAIAALAITAIYAQRIRAIDYFRDALLKAHTDESVVLDGHAYRVRNGTIDDPNISSHSRTTFRVLSLAYERALAERNPLFALVGVDPTSFASTIDALHTSQQTFAGAQTNERDTYLVQTALYPIDFLRDANDLETARVAFLASGSAEDAQAYERDEVRTARAYTDDLSKFDAAFQEAVPVQSGSYATESFIVSRADVLNAIEILTRGAWRTKWRMLERTLCLRGLTRVCDPADILMPSVATSVTPPLTTVQSEVVARVRDLYARVLASLGRAPYESRSPLVHLSTSACIKQRTRAALVFDTGSFIPLSDTPAQLRGIPRSMYAGDIVFEKTAAYARFPFFKYFADHDIDYVWTKPLTYYECPELQRDQSTIFSIIAIADFALRERISSYASGADASALASIERRFAASNGTISEEDARQYLSTARRLILEERVPRSIETAYDALALTLDDGTAGLNETINTSVFIDTANENVAQRGVDYDVSARNLFFVRSAFTILFLENNPSVVGTHANLLPANTLAPDAQPYVYYSDLPNTAPVQQQVFTATAFYYGLHL